MNQMLTINTTKFKRIAYSFVIAFVFWFFIKSEDSYTVNLDIPLVARNLQEQKTYKEEVPESIFVTLKGTFEKMNDSGIIIKLDDEIEGLIPMNKISKDQKKTVVSSLNEGDALDLLVVEVKSDDKNIILMLDESNVDD